MGSCVCKDKPKGPNATSIQGVENIPGSRSYSGSTQSSRQTPVICVADGLSTVDGHNGGIVENGNISRGGVNGAGGEPAHSTTGEDNSRGNAARQRQELRIVIDNNLSSPVIDSLVLQTLAIIRTLVDNEQPPPDAMIQLHKIADVEVGWLAIVYSMINKITSTDPLGPAVITLILDECPLPSKEAIMKLTLNLDVSKHSAIDGRHSPMKQRNICILYGFLAEKLAGATSVALLTDSVLGYLLENLEIDKEPYVILHAIVALEKFALTSVLVSLYWRLRGDYNSAGENKAKVISRISQCQTNALLCLEEWRYETENNLRREVGFCAEWTLDNLFVPPERTFTYELTSNSNLNAMLNSNDTSEYLKISTTGLEARSDVLSFESVRCTFQMDGGAWYYEVELVTNGVLQIGWATKYSKFLNYDGFGIGDDEFSLAYDGCRQLIWHNAQSSKHTHPCWHPGDVLGCFLDVENKEAIFSLNGNPLPSMNQIFQNATKGFFAAASFMTFQQCIFNFGMKPFKFPPSGRFSSFNEKGVLTDRERLVLPRHKKIEILRRMSVKEDGCQLCYDNQAHVTLRPCGHSGFCSKCAIQLEICPLCRTAIEQVDNEHVSGSSSSTKNNRESDIHLRSQLSHDKSTEHVRPTSSRTSDDQSIK